MEWLFSLAFIPVLLCGLMCVVPMALAAVGLRRRASQQPGCDDQVPHQRSADQVESVAR